MSVVLYRKYRPQTFAEIIGQEHVVQTLTNALAMGLTSHAYLFGGPRGCGKTTIARVLAKALNCQNRKEGEGEPCNQCDSCLEINSGRALDLIEIDAATHTGVDDIRELREGIQYVPSKSKYKIYIIDECHQLSKGASNALLKTLEEPPSHAIFILATTEIHKMIPTIISRCQRFDFRRLTLPEIIKRLEIVAKKEKVKIEQPALELIAVNSGGSLRDAESLLDQVMSFSGVKGEKDEIKAQDLKDILGLVEIKTVADFCDLFFQKKAGEAIKLLNETIDRGLDIQEFAKALVNYLRQALVLKITGSETGNPIITGLTKEELQRLKSQTEVLSEAGVQKALNLVIEAENKTKYSPIPQLPLELAIVEYCNII